MTVAKVVKMFSSEDEDMKEYQKKLWNHRRNVLLRCVLIAAAVFMICFCVRYYFKNRSFSRYVVAASVQRTDTLTTKYAQFGGDILKYSRDGISYTDQKNSLYFSITYTMQDPILALSKKAGAVADRNGNQIYTFDQTKQKGQIQTLLPIKSMAVSDQGVVAVLLENSNSVKLEVYSPDGKMIGDGEFTLESAGYPLGLAISSDGTKIAVTFAQISGTKYNSCIAVYNFDDVGENHVDHLVFSKIYDWMIPEIHYYDQSSFSAAGDGILAFYNGKQIPELVKEITFDEELKSVFYGENSTGLVLKAAEGYLFRLYDMKGDLLSEFSFSLDYDCVRITKQSIVIYNGSQMELYSYGGKKYFEQNFEIPLLDIFPAGSRSRYLFIYPNETQAVKLQ